MPEKNRPLAAATWMSGSIAAFSAMAIATRAIKGAHGTFEILAYRSVVGFALVLGLAFALGGHRKITLQRLPDHALRNVVHFTGQALWFFAVTQIPLAQVFALEFTAPLWVILLSPLLLAERLTRLRLFAAMLGFVGVLLVARPDFGQVEPGVMSAAACALFFALNMILTKRLTRSEALVSILFWMCLIQAVFGFSMAVATAKLSLPSSATLPWLALIGIAGVTAHLCLTRALQLAPASVVGPIDFARLPLIALIGAAFYDEPLTAWLILGAGLILTANWLTLRHEARAKAHQQ